MKITRLYNFMYFGPEREDQNVSGHVGVHLLEKSFAIVDILEYGGLTYTGPQKELPEVTESFVRQVHDVVISGRYEPSKESEQPDYQYYPIYPHRISANIGVGDLVTNGKEAFTVDYTHDIRYINRNQFYRLVNRPQFDPKPVTREYFLAKMENINPFEKWSKADKCPKGVWKKMTIKGVKYQTYADDNTYHIEVEGNIWKLKSNISAPFYDTIDRLTREVFVKYKNGNPYQHVAFETTSSYEYDRFVLFEEAESLHYNNALIKYLGEM